MPIIEAICISEKKGTVKYSVRDAIFVTGNGIEGDAHAGNWHRQVSLLPGESIDKMKILLPDLNEGAFAENIITRRLNFHDIKIGERLKINGEIILEITQIGKECHAQCAIGRATGECIMPREGLFAKVISGGSARPGDTIEMCYSSCIQMSDQIHPVTS